MKLVKDIIEWIKEWNDWGMKDWLKAGIVVVVVIVIVGAIQIVLQLLLKPLLGVAGQAVSGFIETKKAKAENKLVEIKAKTKLKEQQIAGEVSWEASAVDQMKGSWKDELILICLLTPAVLVFVPGMTPHIEAGFLALHSLPEYYKHLLYLACSVSFGVKMGPAAMSLFKKKK